MRAFVSPIWLPPWWLTCVFFRSQGLKPKWYIWNERRWKPAKRLPIAYYRWYYSDWKIAPACIRKTIILPNELDSWDIRVSISSFLNRSITRHSFLAFVNRKTANGMYPQNDHSTEWVSQFRHPCINLCFLDWSVICHSCLAFAQKCFQTFPNFQKKAFHHQYRAVSFFFFWLGRITEADLVHVPLYLVGKKLGEPRFSAYQWEIPLGMDCRWCSCHRASKISLLWNYIEYEPGIRTQYRRELCFNAWTVASLNAFLSLADAKQKDDFVIFMFEMTPLIERSEKFLRSKE